MFASFLPFELSPKPMQLPPFQLPWMSRPASTASFENTICVVDGETTLSTVTGRPPNEPVAVLESSALLPGSVPRPGIGLLLELSRLLLIVYVYEPPFATVPVPPLLVAGLI